VVQIKNDVRKLKQNKTTTKTNLAANPFLITWYS
jgi:hypothetical protein